MSLYGAVSVDLRAIHMSPMARLIVVLMEDNLSEAGPHSRMVEFMAKWTVQPASVVQDGLAELERLGLVYLDQHDTSMDGHPAVWIAFVKGWERDWETALWQRIPPKRKPVPSWLRDLVMARDGYRCAQCGVTTDLTIDHKHPVSRGGLTVEANLRVLCRSHNSAKSNTILAVA